MYVPCLFCRTRPGGEEDPCIIAFYSMLTNLVFPSSFYSTFLHTGGANGQKALSNASILCLGTSSSGIETLKNLVLPGIGSFTIVDDGLINGREEETVGGGSGQPEGNFFLTRENVGER